MTHGEARVGLRAERANPPRCASEGCRNRARVQRRFCCSCRSREQDRRNPLRRLFRNLKAHAKARRKTFRLTFEQFEELALAGGYHVGAGRTRDGLCIDRVDARRGYEPGNLQVITNAENARRERWRQLGIEPGDADESEADGPALWEEVA